MLALLPPPQAARAAIERTRTGIKLRTRTGRAYRLTVANAGRGDSVAGVRRLIPIAFGVLVPAGFVLGVAQPAAAHICAAVTKAPVGKSTTVALVVAVEDKPIPDIEFTLPEGLRLDRVDPKPEWKATRSGSTIRYNGGPAATYSCQRFSVGLTPTAKGAYPISVIQRAADGTVVARSTADPSEPLNPYLEQIVYAGVEPPPPPSQDEGTSPLLYVAVGLIGLAVGLMLFMFFRNRRLDAREDELQDRVEAFKARTRDRPPPA